ncbi:MAG TPA: SRPBCC domain-containing protein [Candidatus Saccharimonadales bacterium]|nr:SRPBCC domain-containing protein [Candidatus Saccharimonadales bacterium]
MIDSIAQVSKWWAKDFTGNASNIGDTFTVKFKAGDTFTLKVIEIIPDKKVLWEVLDAYQGWVQDPKEWVGTRIMWNIAPVDDNTEVRFTHEGLVPTLECYGTCQAAWEYLMKQSLAALLNTGTGLPA